jgi:hypothetical protein
MKRASVVREIRPVAEPQAPRLRAVPAPDSNVRGAGSSQVASVPNRGEQRPGLTTAIVDEIRETGVVLLLRGALVPATLDASVHLLVIEGARARGERVLVEVADDGSVVVLGALRAQPTPGIDAADAYSIQAKRISLEAGEELSLKAQTAALVLRAVGEVETYAERIMSRAEGLHKIVGRMLRLN